LGVLEWRLRVRINPSPRGEESASRIPAQSQLRALLPNHASRLMDVAKREDQLLDKISELLAANEVLREELRLAMECALVR
jgi:hypothetical protein